MVAAHHGQRHTLPELRQRHSLSLKGATLTRLIGIADRMGFLTRALRLDMHDLDKLSLPCIVHWDLNHFVVLKQVSRTGVTIVDPAFGERRLPLDEVSKHFTGVALELAPGADFKRKEAAPHVTARQLTGPIQGLWRAFGMIIALSVCLQACAILAPFFMQWIVDQVLVSADRDLLTVLGIGFGSLLLLQVAIGVLRGWSVVHLSARLGTQWAANVFGHLLKLPLEFFEKRHLGDITSRMGAVQAIQRTLTTSFIEALIDGLMAIVTLAMMLLYSWKLTLVTALAVVLYLSLRMIAFRAVRDGTEQQLLAAANQQSHLFESIRGMQSVKIAGCESLRNTRYQNLLGETINRDVRLQYLGLGFGSSSQLIFGIERVAVIWIGTVLAMQNVFSVGMLIAYLAYKDQFAQRASGLIDKWVEFRMLRLHGERLADIVLAEPEEGDLAHAARLPDAARIEASGLSFRYADGEPLILNECSFCIEPGESVAIVGASGCGKTTLVKLMLGLLSPSAGQVNVGGQPIERIGAAAYRSMVGAVMQDDQLFAGSIADNIAFGNENYELAEVEEAAKLAAVDAEIAAMPMGYHSLIGDMGTSLSGGQKQRVLLARALYRQPRILFLDEATSHLDVERERLVNEAVRSMALTRVIIAHRPETIASADRVLVMHAGRIVQELRPQKAPAPASAPAADAPTPTNSEAPVAAIA